MSLDRRCEMRIWFPGTASLGVAADQRVSHKSVSPVSHLERCEFWNSDGVFRMRVNSVTCTGGNYASVES